MIDESDEANKSHDELRKELSLECIGGLAEGIWQALMIDHIPINEREDEIKVLLDMIRKLYPLRIRDDDIMGSNPIRTNPDEDVY